MSTWQGLLIKKYPTLSFRPAFQGSGVRTGTSPLCPGLARSRTRLTPIAERVVRGSGHKSRPSYLGILFYGGFRAIAA